MSASLSRRGARWLVGALLVSHVGAGVKGIMGLACLSDGRCAMTNDNTSALCVLSRGAPSSTTNEGLAARMIWNGTGDDQIHGVTFINASHLAVALQARDLIAVVSARGGGLAATYELAPGSGPIYVARAAAFSIAVTLKDAGSAALVDVGGGAPSGAAAQQLTADGVIPDAHGVYATADSACLLVTYREAGRGGVWELCAGRGYEELGSWPGLNLHQIVPLPGPASNDTFVLLDRSAGALYLWSRAAPSELALVAGSNTTTGFCDGVGADARFDSPHALSLYDDHSVLVGDTANFAVRRVFVRDGGARVFGTVTTVAVFTSADPCGGGSAAPPSPFPPCADGASPAALQLRDSDLVPTQRGAHARFWVTWPFFWGGVGGAGVLLLVRFSLRRRTHAYMALPGG